MKINMIIHDCSNITWHSVKSTGNVLTNNTTLSLNHKQSLYSICKYLLKSITLWQTTGPCVYSTKYINIMARVNNTKADSRSVRLQWMYINTALRLVTLLVDYAYSKLQETIIWTRFLYLAYLCVSMQVLNYINILWLYHLLYCNITTIC